jgi:hypothetical protein
MEARVNLRSESADSEPPPLSREQLRGLLLDFLASLNETKPSETPCEIDEDEATTDQEGRNQDLSAQVESFYEELRQLSSGTRNGPRYAKSGSLGPIIVGSIDSSEKPKTEAEVQPPPSFHELLKSDEETAESKEPEKS